LKYKPISAGNPANKNYKLISGAVIYVEVGIFSFRIKFHPELQIDVPLKNLVAAHSTQLQHHQNHYSHPTHQILLQMNHNLHQLHHNVSILRGGCKEDQEGRSCPF
jgi:hypothetical protein